MLIQEQKHPSILPTALEGAAVADTAPRKLCVSRIVILDVLSCSLEERDERLIVACCHKTSAQSLTGFLGPLPPFYLVPLRTGSFRVSDDPNLTSRALRSQHHLHLPRLRALPLHPSGRHVDQPGSPPRARHPLPLNAGEHRAQTRRRVLPRWPVLP